MSNAFAECARGTSI